MPRKLKRLVLHGLCAEQAFRAGCRIRDSIVVTVQARTFVHCGTWGISIDSSDDVTLAGNQCGFSGRKRHPDPRRPAPARPLARHAR